MSLLSKLFNNKKEDNNAIQEQANYIKQTDNYTLEISSDIMSEKTLQYATHIVEKYFKEENKILNYYLDVGLRDFYKTNFNYSDQYIKENLGKPYIIINFKNEGNDNWKFKYAGIIDYNENKLDEHILSIEFSDDLKFDDYIQFNG